ncbi:MAG TPA: hypothetical protein V6C78_16240 [Crinalium sp.]
MAQASLQRQRVNSIQTTSSSLLNRKALETLWLETFKGSKLWLWGAGGFAILLLVNPAIVLSLLTGSGMMWVAYQTQRRRWRISSRSWRKWWNAVDQKLTVTIGSGVLAALSTYMAIAIWSDSNSPWLATGIILQGAATMGALLFLIWRGLNQTSDRPAATSFDQMLNNLTDTDPLKRLIAIRQATQWILQTERAASAQDTRLAQGLTPRDTAKAHLADCFHLMLNRETDPILRSALLDGLQSLNHSKASSHPASNNHQLPAGSAPVEMPAPRRRTHTRAKHPEYAEP